VTNSDHPDRAPSRRDIPPPTDTPNFDFPTRDVLVTEREPSAVRALLEWLVVIVGAVVLALVIKTFLFQAFYIPSESMVPTLEIGDRVLVNKLSYRLHDINRGDIVVFERPPADQSGQEIEDLIKRVIGLPGDRLVIRDGQIYLNGQLLSEPYLPSGTRTENGPYEKCTEDRPCVIPEGTIWVMGDNRGSSRDSRWFGPIRQDAVVGRAFFRIWPFGRFGSL
jgi:signal peptidase I